MQALSTLRTRWIDLADEETRLLRELTVSEGLRQFALLYEAYASRLSEDAAYQAEVENLVQRQSQQLDDQYVLHWLSLLEQALDDSTLVTTYLHLRRQ